MGPGLFHQAVKGIRVVNRGLRKHFSVQRDTRFAQSLHEAAVGDPPGPAGCRDSGNPETPEIAFFPFTMRVGGRHRPVHRLRRGPIEPAAGTVVSAGHFETPFAALARCRSIGGSYHLSTPRRINQADRVPPGGDPCRAIPQPYAAGAAAWRTCRSADDYGLRGSGGSCRWPSS